MNPDKLILLVINRAGGRISGKTLLQKRAYFLSKALNWDLGFRPHFYGPYSPEIESGIGQLKSLGFIEEKTLGFGMLNEQGFEVRRYDYELTDDGKEIVKQLCAKEPEISSRVKDILDRLSAAGDHGDYLTLSIAAKTYHVLDEQHKPMKNDEIRSVAQMLGWNIAPDSIEKAVSFLEGMGLVARG